MVTKSPTNLLSQAPDWEAELTQWMAEVELLEKRIGARQRLLAALRAEAELAPTTPTTLFERPAPEPASTGNGNGRPKSDSPRTADAVLRIVEESDQPMTAGEVFAELENRGWAPKEAKNPRNSVRTALWHLAKRDQITKLGAGTGDRRWASKSSLSSSMQEGEGEAAG